MYNNNNESEEGLKEGKRYYAAFVSIDYAGSTKLIDTLGKEGKEEAERRLNFYRDTADRIFEDFKGIVKGWSGEGNFFFFFYSVQNKAVEDNSVKAAIKCLLQLKVGIDVEIPVRISIGSGIVEYKKDLGKITSLEISRTGHINSACPENSILITENVYFALSKELKDKFKICGTAKRDKVLTFIYPAEKKEKINKEYFLDEKEDYSKDYFDYIKFIESSNRTLLVSGVRQIERIPTLDLEEGFFQLRLEKAEKKIISEDLVKKFEEEKKLKFAEKEIIKDIKEITKITAPCNFLDALKTDKHIVLLGDPGSGKTTLLKYIALIYSRGLKKVYERLGFDECLLPIIVPISAIYLQIENKSFVDAISDYYKIQGIENTEKFIKEKLDKGKCIILLDGLDEIPAYEGRFSIAKNIENFIRMYGNNRFIITSRIIGYEKINIDSITEYYVSHLDDNEIKKFVDNWFTAFEKKVKEGMPENAIKKIVDNETAQLISSINEDKNIKDLSRNPFLLSLICIVQKSGNRLPRYRVELYRIIAETLFETWVMARRISASTGKPMVESRDYKESEKVLAPMALWMHENLPGGVGKEDAIKEKIIEIMKERGTPENEARNTTNNFFKYLAEQTQLIIPKGKDYYGFRHLSFEEFLAARALIMKEKYEEYLKKYSKDPRWTEVFLLTAGWIGIVDGREEEITRIVKQLTASKNLDDLMLAGRIVAENLGVKKDAGKEVINEIGNEWLSKFLRGLQPEASEIISKILKKTLLRDEGKETYEKFVNIIKIKDREENENARIVAFSSRLSFRFFDREENENARIVAAYGLFPLVKEDENIKEISVKVWEDKKENRAVRIVAAEGLFPLVRRDENIKEIFVKILEDKEENEDMRIVAAEGLSSLVRRDENIKEIFVKTLEDGKENEQVREVLRKILKDRREHEYVEEVLQAKDFSITITVT